MKNLKLKYYLRGLGIGVLVTAFILGVTDSGETLTDAQIRERAMELGMVDSASIMLSDLKDQEKNEQLTENISEAEVSEEESSEETSSDSESVDESLPNDVMSEEAVEEPTDESSEENSTGESSEENSAGEPSEEIPTEEASEQPSSEEISSEESETPETVTITIKSGASSYGVSKDLEAAGLVESARDFDTYLCDNGYSRKIRIGTYEIEVGADEEEIAKIITGKR